MLTPNSGWEYGSPDTLSYGQLASKIAELSGAIVMVPDFPLTPVGDYHATRHLSGPDGTSSQGLAASESMLRGGDALQHVASQK